MGSLEIIALRSRCVQALNQREPLRCATAATCGSCTIDKWVSHRLPVAAHRVLAHPDPVTDESKIATHTDPVGRDRTNYIIRLDLTEHGLPGHFEQCWTRTHDQRLFELCCIPFFTYGQSLGDILEVNAETGRHKVHSKPGHRTVRFAFTNDWQAHEQHDHLHGVLVDCAAALRSFDTAAATVPSTSTTHQRSLP